MSLLAIGGISPSIGSGFGGGSCTLSAVPQNSIIIAFAVMQDTTGQPQFSDNVNGNWPGTQEFWPGTYAMSMGYITATQAGSNTYTISCILASKNTVGLWAVWYPPCTVSGTPSLFSQFNPGNAANSLSTGSFTPASNGCTLVSSFFVPATATGTLAIYTPFTQEGTVGTNRVVVGDYLQATAAAITANAGGLTNGAAGGYSTFGFGIALAPPVTATQGGYCYNEC